MCKRTSFNEELAFSSLSPRGVLNCSHCSLPCSGGAGSKGEEEGSIKRKKEPAWTAAGRRVAGTNLERATKKVV